MLSFPPVDAPIDAKGNKLSFPWLKWINELWGVVSGIESMANYALRYDYVDATTSYLGEAVPGSLSSAAVWRVKLLTFAGDDVTVTYADGDSDFDNVWDNRASLTYS